MVSTELGDLLLMFARFPKGSVLKDASVQRNNVPSGYRKPLVLAAINNPQRQ